jgi:hypothetical protein
MDPIGLANGVVALVAIALRLVVGAIGRVDKTIAAYDEAGDELKDLQQDLEMLRMQVAHIHETLQALASNTKDRGFKRLLRECVLVYSLGDVDRS